jgi:diaminopimelate decarboxylase
MNAGGASVRGRPALLPVTYRVNERGHVEVGGCDLIELAGAHGTPLYVYDRETARRAAREYVDAMGDRGDVLYSAKAFASPAFLRLMGDEGLGLDVLSAGELELGLRSGIPAERVHFLGNNKSAEDVEAAYRAGATLVIDGAQEFDLIRRVVPAGRRLRCEVRLSPGVAVDTHDFIATGQLDSKFGFPIESGAARAAIERALGEDRIDLAGLHSHLGSQIVDLRGHQAAMAIMVELMAGLARDVRWRPGTLTPAAFVATLLAAMDAECARCDVPPPRLAVEPGRSIAGPAGMAVYTVGAIKDIPGVRRYVAVDGGMGDNIRPKLYGARYEALIADRPNAAPTRTVTIAGKYCESTDILIQDIALPEPATGDVLCVPAAGAYCLSMASRYNGIPGPEVVMVGDGEARVMRRRETVDDLLRNEIF